ncbi:MAG: transposase [Planctomycetota bacterium]
MEPRRRKSLRLPGFDYTTANPYFVTVCVQRRECLFGEIGGGAMHENIVGRMVRATWDELPQRFPHLTLDAFVVMPNHVHGILFLNLSVAGAELALPSNASRLPNAGGASPAPTPKRSLGEVMGCFKSLSAISVNRHLGRLGYPLWQRNYYEHITRDETALEKFRGYIRSNPLRWENDKENPLASCVSRSG